MKFLHPEFFYYMLAPLVFFFWLLLTQKEARADFFSQEVLDKLRVVTDTLTLKARNALFFFAGVFIIVALAQPVLLDGKVEVKQKSADILIALDISNSMLANDFYPNRLEFAKKKAIELIRTLPQERIGVVAFAKHSYLVSPLSFDHEAVAFLLRNLDTSSITEQGTDVMALLSTVASASKRSKRKYLVLFSDGGEKQDFSKEIEFAKENGISVFVLAVATQRGAPIRLPDGTFLRYKGETVIAKRNERIADLALATHGVYIEATNSDADIEAMKKELIETVQRKEYKAKTIEKYVQLFYLPLGLAMILILIALSSMTKRTKVHIPSMWIVGILLSLNTSAYGGLFDFVDAAEARDAYEKKSYKESAQAFQRYARNHPKAEAFYDTANAYYKSGRYDKAIEYYQKVKSSDANLMAQTLHNLGNAYAKTKRFEDAIKAYEEALKLKKDRQTRENLEALRKFLKQKKERKDNQKSQSKHPNQNKERRKNEHSDDRKKNAKEESAASNERQRKSSNEQNGKNRSQKASSKQKEHKQNESKQEDEQRLRRKNDDTKKTQNNKRPLRRNEKNMSDAEERKWLRYINEDTKTFMYKMESRQSQPYEGSDEKPW